MRRATPVAVGCVRGGPPRTTWLAASEHGIVRVCLGGDRAGLLAALEAAGWAPGGPRRWLAPGLRQLDAYYQGRRRRFRLAVVMPAGSRFASRVYAALQELPYGSTCTYGQLAVRAGRAGAARAVGRLMASNPLPILIPCHRVVAASGLGGFGGGLELKEALLRLEGVAIGSGRSRAPGRPG